MEDTVLGTQKSARQSLSSGGTQGLDQENAPSMACLSRSPYHTPALFPMKMPTADHLLVHNYPSEIQIILALFLLFLSKF